MRTFLLEVLIGTSFLLIGISVFLFSLSAFAAVTQDEPKEVILSVCRNENCSTIESMGFLIRHDKTCLEVNPREIKMSNQGNSSIECR